MADNKITFGRPKTSSSTATYQPTYIQEPLPEAVDNTQVYDFGKKYQVLEYQFKDLKEGAVYSAGFEAVGLPGSILFTTTFFNIYGKELSSTSVEIPEGTAIEDVTLDYQNKKLLIHTVQGPIIECDLSELIDKVNLLEQQVADINSDIYLDQQKTLAFYTKTQIDDKIDSLNYETGVGTTDNEPDTRTWFDPVDSGIETFQSLEQPISMSSGPEVVGSTTIEVVPESVPGTTDEISYTSSLEGTPEQQPGTSGVEVGVTTDSQILVSEQQPGTSGVEVTMTSLDTQGSVSEQQPGTSGVEVGVTSLDTQSSVSEQQPGVSNVEVGATNLDTQIEMSVSDSGGLGDEVVGTVESTNSSELVVGLSSGEVSLIDTVASSEQTPGTSEVDLLSSNIESTTEVTPGVVEDLLVGSPEVTTELNPGVIEGELTQPVDVSQTELNPGFTENEVSPLAK